MGDLESPSSSRKSRRRDYNCRRPKCLSSTLALFRRPMMLCPLERGRGRMMDLLLEACACVMQPWMLVSLCTEIHLPISFELSIRHGNACAFLQYVTMFACYYQ